MQIRQTALAIAAALVAFATRPADALSLTTAAAPFSNSTGPVVDSEGGGATILSNLGLGTSQIDQFDPSVGVLTGVTLSLTSTRTQAVGVTSTAGGGTGSNGNVTSSGTGSSDARIAAPGIVQTFGAISTSDGCVDHRRGACSDGASTDSFATDANLSTGSLDSYVGTAQATITRTAPKLSANQSSNVFTGTESTSNTLTWAGTVSATYEYLLHAAPSFDGVSQSLVLTLDFGTVHQGEPFPSLGFDIFNLAGERVSLGLDSLFGNGDVATLAADLGPFANLGAGSYHRYWARFDTSVIGDFTAQYILGLADDAVGAASSRSNDHTLALNLKGTVTATPAHTPEIDATSGVGALSLLAGALALAAERRRKAA